MKKYSIIVPIFNEEKNVTPLHQEIIDTMSKLDQEYEIIFINDGSTDGTHEKISQLRPLKYIRLGRNYGQTAALDAGIKAAEGEIFITLDGDGQNPPSEIPKLLKKLEEGFDVVSGWRVHRQDAFLKKFSSRCAHVARGFLIKDGIHDSGCSLKVYKREVFHDLDLYGENHRFIPALVKIQGYRITELPVEHRPRTHGQSKYNWKRGVKGMVDMIGIWFWRKYASRPLHVFGGGGIIIEALGIGSLGLLFILRLLGIISLADSIWPLISVMLILVGIQLFISGIVADLLVKNHFATTKKTYYRIKEIKIQEAPTEQIPTHLVKEYEKHTVT